MIEATPMGKPVSKRTRANSRNPESKVLAKVKAWAADKPDVYLTRVVEAGASGTPDFIACIHGHYVAIECKSATGKPTALQLEHGVRIHRACGRWLCGDDTVLIPALDAIYREIHHA